MHASCKQVGMHHQCTEQSWQSLRNNTTCKQRLTSTPVEVAFSFILSPNSSFPIDPMYATAFGFCNIHYIEMKAGELHSSGWVVEKQMLAAVQLDRPPRDAQCCQLLECCQNHRQRHFLLSMRACIHVSLIHSKTTLAEQLMEGVFDGATSLPQTKPSTSK
jgi:hypothetical protein